jgi:hypothetical protein
MTKESDYADKVISVILVLTHKWLFKYKPLHAEDSIRILEGIVQCDTKEKLDIQLAKPTIWLSPHVERRLQQWITWISKERNHERCQ